MNPAAQGASTKARLSGTTFLTHSRYRDNMGTPLTIARCDWNNAGQVWSLSQ